MTKPNYQRLIIALILPQLAGAIGSFFTAPALSVWYAGLVKPSFNPPGWIFGPVWTGLYLLMGLSAYLIWQKTRTESGARPALILFWVHLLFNAAWSLLFFGLHSPGLAFIDLLFIWLFIIFLIIKFFRLDPRAAYLLIPYWAWVSFAGVLNYFIWRLN